MHGDVGREGAHFGGIELAGKPFDHRRVGKIDLVEAYVACVRSAGGEKKREQDCEAREHVFQPLEAKSARTLANGISQLKE